MSSETYNLFRLLQTEVSLDAFENLMRDSRIQSFIDHMAMEELAEGVIAAAFMNAANPRNMTDSLDKTFTAAALKVDEPIVHAAREAIREYAAIVEAQAYRAN